MSAWTKTCARRRLAALPLRRHSFDLVTLGCAWHWCETEPLLREVAQVLGPGGWLVVYDSYFLGLRPESSELSDWLDAEYYPRVPRTPRNPLPDPSTDAPPPFVHAGVGGVDEWIPMTLERLVTYLTTQSSTIAGVETGAVSLAAAESLLREGLARFFPDPETPVPFHFGGPIWFLRRADTRGVP